MDSIPATRSTTRSDTLDAQRLISRCVSKHLDSIEFSSGPMSDWCIYLRLQWSGLGFCCWQIRPWLHDLPFAIQGRSSHSVAACILIRSRVSLHLESDYISWQLYSRECIVKTAWFSHNETSYSRTSTRHLGHSFTSGSCPDEELATLAIVPYSGGKWILPWVVGGLTIFPGNNSVLATSLPSALDVLLRGDVLVGDVLPW